MAKIKRFIFDKKNKKNNNKICHTFFEYCVGAIKNRRSNDRMLHQLEFTLCLQLG